MNLDDYTPEENDEIKAISILVACVEKMKATLPRINNEARPVFDGDIKRIEGTIEWLEQRMANVAKHRKRNLLA